MATFYYKLKNDCYRNVFSYDCLDHDKAEVVSTRRYQIGCLMHTPIYLFDNIYNKHFLHFHWVRTLIKLNYFFFHAVKNYGRKKYQVFFLTETRIATLRNNLQSMRCELNKSLELV